MNISPKYDDNAESDDLVANAKMTRRRVEVSIGKEGRMRREMMIAPQEAGKGRLPS